MDSPTKDRLELVFLADQPAPIRLWTQTTENLARRYEWDKDKSVKILAGVGVALLLLLYLFPGATAMLALVSVMVLFPLKLVGMAGYSRGA